VTAVDAADVVVAILLVNEQSRGKHVTVAKDEPFPE
jgi:hypothetical protein